MIAVFSASQKTISSTFGRTAILHLFDIVEVRATQTKYEAEVEIMHLSSKTQGSVSTPRSRKTGQNRPAFVSDILYYTCSNLWDDFHFLT